MHSYELLCGSGGWLVNLQAESGIDWDRKPVSSEGEKIVEMAVDATLKFLRGRPSVFLEQFRPEPDAERYRQVATPIVLAAIDALVTKTEVVAEPSKDVETWLAEHGSDWQAVSSVIQALSTVGMVEFRDMEHPEGFACRYRLSDDLQAKILGQTAGEEEAPRRSDGSIAETLVAMSGVSGPGTDRTG